MGGGVDECKTKQKHNHHSCSSDPARARIELLIMSLDRVCWTLPTKPSHIRHQYDAVGTLRTSWGSTVARLQRVICSSKLNPFIGWMHLYAESRNWGRNSGSLICLERHGILRENAVFSFCVIDSIDHLAENAPDVAFPR